MLWKTCVFEKFLCTTKIVFAGDCVSYLHKFSIWPHLYVENFINWHSYSDNLASCIGVERIKSFITCSFIRMHLSVFCSFHPKKFALFDKKFALFDKNFAVFRQKFAVFKIKFAVFKIKFAIFRTKFDIFKNNFALLA